MKNKQFINQNDITILHDDREVWPKRGVKQFGHTKHTSTYLTGADLILLNIMSLDIDIIYTNDIFRLQSSDTTFGALLYLA